MVKAETIGAMLERGPIVVWVDGRVCAGLPERLRVQPAVGLRIGYDLTPAIPDLTLGSYGWSGSLAFDGSTHHVEVPWCAVFVVKAESNPSMSVSWPDSTPTVDAVVPPPRRGLRLVD